MDSKHDRASGLPFRVLRGASLTPLLLTCEHAGRALPVPAPRSPEMSRLMSSHWAWDIGGWELTRGLSRHLDSAAIGGTWSRLWIDLNRRVDDPTLIRTEAGRVALPWNDGLGPDDVERRIDRFHAPYHQQVDRLIMRRLVRGVRPLVLAIHTFTPRLRGPRRRFDVGLLYADHRGLAHRLGRAIRETGLDVRYNQPYSGLRGLMYAADRHGTHHGLPCLEIEINQGIVESAAAVARLARALSHPLGTIAGSAIA